MGLVFSLVGDYSFFSRISSQKTIFLVPLRLLLRRSLCFVSQIVTKPSVSVSRYSKTTSLNHLLQHIKGWRFLPMVQCGENTIKMDACPADGSRKSLNIIQIFIEGFRG